MRQHLKEHAIAENRQAMSALRAARASAGHCVQCNAPPPLATLRRCTACADARLNNERRRKDALKAEGLPTTTTQKRSAAGLCGRCGGQKDLPGYACSTCRGSLADYRSDGGAKLIENRRAAGLCLRCEQPASDGQHCAEHASMLRASCLKATRKLRVARVSTGFCWQCDKASWGRAANRCAYHYTKAIISNYVRKVSTDIVDSVTAKFTGYCAYTGVSIVPGETAQLEHIYPKKLRPDLIAEPSNLIWVHVAANDAKADLSPDDPIADAILAPAFVAKMRALATGVKLSS